MRLFIRAAVPGQTKRSTRHCSVSAIAPVCREAAFGWRWSTVQLEAGDLALDTVIRTDRGVLLGRTSVNRVTLLRARSPTNFISLLMHSSRAAAMFVAGIRLSRGVCLCVRPDTEIELIAHRHSACLLISLPAEIARREPRSQLAPGLPAGVDLIELPGNEHEMLEDCICTTLRNTRSCEIGPASRRAQHLAARPLLAAPAGTPPLAHLIAPRLAPTRRHLAVERARQYIRERLAERITLAELCAHAHLQARSLEYGFQEITQLTPMRYVRMLRLGEVRRKLLDIANQWRSISEIALDAGLSHLSQFAADYKKTFIETPSQTRQRALAAAARRPKWQLGIETDLLNPPRGTGQLEHRDRPGRVRAIHER